MNFQYVIYADKTLKLELDLNFSGPNVKLEVHFVSDGDIENVTKDHVLTGVNSPFQSYFLNVFTSSTDNI